MSRIEENMSFRGTCEWWRHQEVNAMTHRELRTAFDELYCAHLETLEKLGNAEDEALNARIARDQLLKKRQGTHAQERQYLQKHLIFAMAVIVVETIIILSIIGG